MTDVLLRISFWVGTVSLACGAFIPLYKARCKLGIGPKLYRRYLLSIIFISVGDVAWFVLLWGIVLGWKVDGARITIESQHVWLIKCLVCAILLTKAGHKCVLKLLCRKDELEFEEKGPEGEGDQRPLAGTNLRNLSPKLWLPVVLVCACSFVVLLLYLCRSMFSG